MPASWLAIPGRRHEGTGLCHAEFRPRAALRRGGRAAVGRHPRRRRADGGRFPDGPYRQGRRAAGQRGACCRPAPPVPGPHTRLLAGTGGRLRTPYRRHGVVPDGRIRRGRERTDHAAGGDGQLSPAGHSADLRRPVQRAARGGRHSCAGRSVGGQRIAREGRCRRRRHALGRRSRAARSRGRYLPPRPVHRFRVAGADPADERRGPGSNGAHRCRQPGPLCAAYRRRRGVG